MSAAADAQFRAWMRDNLDHAANHFQLAITGAPRFGWLDRSISAPVRRTGRQYWLRVVSEDVRWSGRRDADSAPR